MKTILYIGSNTCTTLYGPIILWELLYRGWSSRNFMHEGVATCRAVTDWQLCKTICLIAWAPWKGYINMLKFCLHGDSMSLQMKRPSSEWHLSWMYYTMLNNYSTLLYVTIMHAACMDKVPIHSLKALTGNHLSLWFTVCPLIMQNYCTCIHKLYEEKSGGWRYPPHPPSLDQLVTSYIAFLV